MAGSKHRSAIDVGEILAASPVEVTQIKSAFIPWIVFF